jgi:acyl-CoA thioesterase FadM
MQLEIRSRVKEAKGRKIVVSATLSANGEICADGEVVAVQMPDQMARPPQ